MKRLAAIVGAGQTRFGDHPDLSVKELFAEAYREALGSVDKGLDAKKIKALYVGTLGVGGYQIGNVSAALADHVGLRDVAAFRVENACASSSFALLSAVQGILSSQYDVVLVAGVEKMRDMSSDRAKYWLGVSGDTEYERLAGMTFAGHYAIMATRYMHEHSVDKKYLSMIAVKNHYNGSLNPKAQFQKAISLEEALKAPSLAYPLNLYDACPTSDGASVLIVVKAELAKKFTDTPVYVTGFGAGSDTLALHDREDLTGLRATRMAADQAYQLARIKSGDIDFAEVHDCFTIAEIMAYEDLGFAKRGKGWLLADDGSTKLSGRIPVNPSGGLKAKGHPIGATGAAQTYEIFHQLRGTADNPSRQVKGAEMGLSHNVGGSGATATVFIYQR
ncbi:MAG: thiolase domain-containing protein [Thaumarchaeota archaeon]|nr:thiolase domain-containing protein [Nitrososphaerota archaeon]